MAKLYAKVESSAINSVEYDTETQDMTIEFKTSGKYVYPGVPRYHYDGLIKAESVGKYFNREIKKYSINCL